MSPRILLGHTVGKSEPGLGFRANHGPEPETAVFAPEDSHLITIGRTGSGKGVGCLIPTLLTVPNPMIVIDPKGENFAVTAARRQAMGHKVVTLDPFNIGPKELRRGLNPLSLIDRDSPLMVDDAITLIDSISDDPSRGDHAFWVNRSKALLTGVLLASASKKRQGIPPMTTLRAEVSKSHDQLVGLGHQLLNHELPEVRAAGALLTSSAEQTVGGIVAFAQDATSFLAGPLVDSATKKTTLDLDAVKNGDPLTIYILFPPERLESHRKLLRVWMTCLMMTLLRRRVRPKLSTLMLIDEAAQLGNLPQMLTAMTLLRGYGLQLWTFWQDLEQLASRYPNDWRTILGNAGVVQCLGPMWESTATELGRVLGEGLVEDLASAPRRSSITFLEGRAHQLRTPDYRSDLAFRGLFEPNPFFGPEA